MAQTNSSALPPVMKRSRAKIWIRTGLLAIFAGLFGIALHRDITIGVFHYSWAMMILATCLPIGFWMRKLVPMQVHPASQIVTLSFDKIYFTLIWILVIAKFITSRIFDMTLLPDIVMCTILGLMTGRLSGICLKVRSLRAGLTPAAPASPVQ